MKRKPIIIGNKKFKYKKDALSYYKRILNTYDFEERLSIQDENDVAELFLKSKINDERVKVGIKKIIIGKVQYNTKCFKVIFNNDTFDLFSYVLAINGDRTPLTKFTVACRNAIQNDLRYVKQKYFDTYSKNGKVKCQETGVLSSWNELNVDHRQPNTFSVIIDRFIELNNIDVKQIEFTKGDNNLILLKNKEIEKEFKNIIQ